MTPVIEYATENPDHYIQSRQMELEAGVLGKFFGGERNAALNIAGIVACLLIAPALLMLFMSSTVPALEYLKIVLPVVSGILGYLFGRGSHRSS